MTPHDIEHPDRSSTGRADTNFPFLCMKHHLGLNSGRSRDGIHQPGGPDQEEVTLRADGDVAAREIRVDTPRPSAGAHLIAERIGIKKGDHVEVGAGRIHDVEHLDSTEIVRGIKGPIAGVEIVVSHPKRSFVKPHNEGVVQVLYVHHPSPRQRRHLVHFIPLVIHEKEPLILGKATPDEHRPKQSPERMTPSGSPLCLPRQ